jgi:hypothetical protein
MATVDVASSRNITAVSYALGDTINVLDGVTLTINSQWSIRPNLIQALGTGRIEVSNSSTTTPLNLEFYMQNGLSTGGFTVQQNAVLQTRGGWITVATSTGTNNQVLFSSNSIGGVAIDYPTMIQVETGSGTNVWEVWQAIPEDVTSGTNNTYAFNSDNATVGTVAVTAGGAVTGTGTNFVSSNIGLPFKLPSIARDFVISAVASTTSMTIQELDGTTYTGGVIAAGSTYIIRSGSLIAAAQVGGSEVGKVLFFNPLTTAVRMGNDTNGTKIPSGARVRVPNIHFNSALQQTTLATAISGTGAQAFTLTAAIGPTTNGGINANQAVGSFLLVNGATFERIHFLTRAGAVVSATSQLRGQYGTTAQASFPIGTTVYWIPTPNTTANNAGFSCNPSGTIDLQICSVGMRFRNDFSNYANLVLNDFGCFVTNIGSSAGTYNLNTLSVLGASWQAPTAISATVTLNSMLGSGSISSVHANNNYCGNTSGTTLNCINIQNAQAISNLRCRQWGRNGTATTGAFRSFAFTTIKCATPVDGLYMAGGGFVIAATTNIDVKNIFLASLPNGNSNSSTDASSFSTINSTVNSTFRGFQIWGGGIVTRGPLISIDSSCESVVCHNKGYSAIAGSLQTTAIVSDAGLNSIIAFISVTSPRVIAAGQSYLFGNSITNSGGLFRLLLIDTITSTAAGTGGASKSGLELDMVAGPHRLFQTTATASIIPNLVDIQPIVVLSNTAKTVGSVYVGSFSAQGAFDMYTFSGGALLDNLGRIYYPAIGDSVVIKSVFALKGITNFTGTAFDYNYNLGSGANPIPAGTTVEFRMTNWGAANTGAWTAFTNNADLETARAALTGYSSSTGLNLQLRITGTTAVAARYLMSLKLPVTIDATYNPSVYSTNIGFTGAQVGTLIAGYLNAIPSAPVLQSSLTLTSSSGSVPMPYDYDAVPVAYRLVARFPGWTFSSLTGTYTKTAISIPITQTRVLDAGGSPLYVSGVTGVAVNYGASTITLSASRPAVQVWSAVQDSLSLLANLTRDDPFSTSNGSSFASTYTLVVTGTLTAGNITGNVTLSGSLSSGVAITGNVAQATPTNLTGVTITGNLTYATNTPITITLTNCLITGTVSNSGSGLVTISTSGTTIGTVGANVATRPVTSLNINGLTAGSQVYITNGVGAQVAYVASSGTSYTLDTTGQTGTWGYKVARYGFTAQTGTHLPAVATTTVTVTLLADLFITQANKATVAAYTILDNNDKLYDYSAYYETTNAGIPYARVITKAGTSPSAGSYPVTINDTADLFVFDGSSLSIWTNYTLSPGTTITGPLFTSGVVTIPIGFNNASITANVSQLVPSDMSGVIITGNLTYNESAPFLFSITMTNCVITGTISNSGTADVLITKVNTTIGTLGARVTAQQFATVSAPNLLAGTRVRVLNTTDNIELYNDVLASAGFSQAFIYTTNKNITLTATYVSGVTAKLGVSASGILTAGGATFLNTQVDDTVYNGYGINGSTVTGFTADYVNDDVNLSMAGDFMGADLYAWWVYNEATEDGIRNFFGGITALDAGNLRINATTVSLFLDNSTANFIYQNDSIRIFRSDNIYPARTITTGGGGIAVNWQSNVYVGEAPDGLTIPTFLALQNP